MNIIKKSVTKKYEQYGKLFQLLIWFIFEVVYE